jgi:hypothetical protein
VLLEAPATDSLADTGEDTNNAPAVSKPVLRAKAEGGKALTACSSEAGKYNDDFRDEGTLAVRWEPLLLGPDWSGNFRKVDLWRSYCVFSLKGGKNGIVKILSCVLLLCVWGLERTYQCMQVLVKSIRSRDISVREVSAGQPATLAIKLLEVRRAYNTKHCRSH